MTIALFFVAAAALSLMFQQNGSSPPIAAWAPGLALVAWRYGPKRALAAACVVMVALVAFFVPRGEHSPILDLSVTVPFAALALITVFATQSLHDTWRRVCDRQRRGDEIRSLFMDIVEGR